MQASEPACYLFRFLSPPLGSSLHEHLIINQSSAQPYQQFCPVLIICAHVGLHFSALSAIWRTSHASQLQPKMFQQDPVLSAPTCIPAKVPGSLAAGRPTKPDISGLHSPPKIRTRGQPMRDRPARAHPRPGLINCLVSDELGPWSHYWIGGDTASAQATLEAWKSHAV